MNVTAKLLEKVRVAKRHEAQQPDLQCVRNAYSATHAREILGVTPSLTLDKCLSKTGFVITVAGRLGVDVCEGDVPCVYCGIVMDRLGRHCLSCTAGGDINTRHNGVRDIYHDYCQRGGLRPEKEAPRLLQDVLGRHDRHRPADVLCMSSMTLAERLPDGTRSVRTEPIRLDSAVINALGMNHWRETAQGCATASDQYDVDKMRRNNTEERCAEAGLRYQPVVHELQGCVSKGAFTVMHSIAEAVAFRENRTGASVRSEMQARIAVFIARCVARSIRKRSARPRSKVVDWVVASSLAMSADADE